MADDMRKSKIIGQAVAMFGGQIKLSVGYDQEQRSGIVAMSELVKENTVGGHIDKGEETYGEHILLCFDNLGSLNAFREALDIIELAIKNGGIPEELPHGYKLED